jgi:hypothetical protein
MLIGAAYTSLIDAAGNVNNRSLRHANRGRRALIKRAGAQRVPRFYE